MRHLFFVILSVCLVLIGTNETGRSADVRERPCELHTHPWSVSLGDPQGATPGRAFASLESFKQSARPSTTILTFSSLVPRGCFHPGNVLLIEQAFNEVRVRLDDAEVYSYLGDMLPSRFHFVALPHSALNDRHLSIETRAWANARGLSGRVSVLSEGEAYQFILEKYAIRTILLIVFLALSVLSAVLWTFHRQRVRYLYFSLFVLSMSAFLGKFAEPLFFFNVPEPWIIKANVLGLLAAPVFFALLTMDITPQLNRRLGRTVLLLFSADAVFFALASLVAGVLRSEMFVIHTAVVALGGSALLLGSIQAQWRDSAARIQYVCNVFLVIIILLSIIEETGYVSLPYDFFFAGLGVYVMGLVVVSVDSFWKVYDSNRQLVGRLERQNLELEAALQRLQTAKAHESLAQLTYAMSHDIRKPFSLMKVLLSAIPSVKTTQELCQIADSALPEVQRAMDTVDGLLQDIMQFGAPTDQLHLEETTPEGLLDQSLNEIFRGQPDADVSLAYELAPDLVLYVDSSRIKRVFSNIILNACEALSWKGRICITATEQNAFVSFRIRNEGSFLSDDVANNLFEAFFTANKRGGTGLGLAIARKWVVAHGGEIGCHSEKSARFPEGCVDITFTLPAARPARPAQSLHRAMQRPVLVEHSSGYRLNLKLDMNGTGTLTQPPTGMAAEACAELKKRESPLKVLIVDDEETYRMGARSTLECLQVGDLVQFQALPYAAAEELSADLLLFDHDLSAARNGTELIRSYREHGGSGLVCLHTNRTDAQTQRDALDAGADSVFPKPLTAEHLARLLIEACKRSVREQRTKAAKRYPAPVDQPAENNSFNVLFVDDSPIMRLSWRKAIGSKCTLVVCDSPESAAATTQSFDLIVTDMQFDNSDLSGVDVLSWARLSHPLTPVYLCSNGAAPDGALFSGVLAKSTLPDEEHLRRMIKNGAESAPGSRG